MPTSWKTSVLTPMVLGAVLVAGQSSTVTAQEDTSIVIVAPTEPDTLEPCESSNEDIGRIVKQNINETLTDVDPTDGTALPRLATSWEEIDPQTWRIMLREGVVFSDGEPFNAEAVAFNIERAFSEEFICAQINKAFSGYHLTANVVDDYTIDITSDRPDPILPTRFSVLTLASPKTPINEPVRNAAGTGPYKFVEWITGDSVILERKDDYWGETAEVSKVTFVFRPDSAVRAAMTATGEADIGVKIADLDATNPATDFAYLNSETTWLRLDTRFPPVDDLRVRQAFNYAIDRDIMMGTVVNADSIPASQLPVPSIDGHNPDLKPYSYDPDKARALLDEARADGVPVDSEIRFIVRAGQFAQIDEFAQVLTSMFEDVGFDMNLEIMERGRQNRFQAKPLPTDVGPNIMLIMSDNNLGDAAFSIFNYHSDGSQSTTMIPELDDMINQALALTGEERRAAFQEIFQTALDEHATLVPLFHMVGITRVSERLDWKPSIATNSQIDVKNIKFAKAD